MQIQTRWDLLCVSQSRSCHASPAMPRVHGRRHERRIMNQNLSCLIVGAGEPNPRLPVYQQGCPSHWELLATGLPASGADTGSQLQGNHSGETTTDMLIQLQGYSMHLCGWQTIADALFSYEVYKAPPQLQDHNRCGVHGAPL